MASAVQYLLFCRFHTKVRLFVMYLIDLEEKKKQKQKFLKLSSAPLLLE